MLVYIDDIAVSGQTPSKVWERTLVVIVRLHRAGFMINLNKCRFPSLTVEVVGHVVSRRTYMVGDKAVWKFLESQLPQSFHKVQVVHSQMNYLRRFAPDIARVIGPIRALLCKDSKWVWDSACTEALQKVAMCVARRLKLGVV